MYYARCDRVLARLAGFLRLFPICGLAACSQFGTIGSIDGAPPLVINRSQIDDALSSMYPEGLPEGASVAEIGQRLGWLPHRVRAAITGLRHAGREVTRSRDAGMPMAGPCTGWLRRRASAGHGNGSATQGQQGGAVAPPELDIRELREEWRGLYKADASPDLSRELLIRAVAYRTQEVALGGLRPEPQRQLRQIAQELK